MSKAQSYNIGTQWRQLICRGNFMDQFDNSLTTVIEDEVEMNLRSITTEIQQVYTS